MGHRRQQETIPASPARAHTPWGVIFVAAAIVIASAAVALAILLSRSGNASTGDNRPQVETAAATETTAPVEGATSPIAAGRYVQAGSFKSLGDAEVEQRRLAGLGIEAQLIRSELAQELYPGFQVLLVGPVLDRSEERTMIGKLRRGGVPTAFARELTPAATNVPYAEVAGGWSGTLEEISSSHPRLNRQLDVAATFDSSGREGQLEIPSLHCRLTLTLTGSRGSAFSFNQHPPCLGSGALSLRPSGGGLMMTLLPPGNDLIFLGTLNAA